MMEETASRGRHSSCIEENMGSPYWGLTSSGSAVNKINREGGFALLEALLVVCIIATLAAIAIPNYSDARYKAQIAVAISDIKKIDRVLTNYYADHGAYPSSLAMAGLNGLRDPWGNPYEYWPITGDKNQKVRKDRNTHPINTDFDLYSRGRNSTSNLALTASESQDDIIRARNGAYVGLASKF